MNCHFNKFHSLNLIKIIFLVCKGWELLINKAFKNYMLLSTLICLLLLCIYFKYFIMTIVMFCVSEESDPCKSIERRSSGVVGSTQGQVMWLLDLAQPPLSHHQGKHAHEQSNFTLHSITLD